MAGRTTTTSTVGAMLVALAGACLAPAETPTCQQAGTVLGQSKISSAEGGFGGDLDPTDRFGVAVASLGDLDGDGVVDIAVGAPSDDDSEGAIDYGNYGAVWIVFLNPDGTAKAHQKISATEGGFTGQLALEHHFGSSLARLGDLNGDGVCDLAVGALTGDDDGSDYIGAVWVLFLNSDGTVAGHQRISATEGGFEGQLEFADAFGMAIASLGDLDGDGVTDLAVGALGDDDGGENAGALWVLFLNSDGTVKAHQKVSQTAGGFTGDLPAAGHFGSSVGCIGDLDGDGVVELGVGSFRDASVGAIWVLFMNADGTVKGHQKVSSTEGGLAGPLEHDDYFGSSVTPLGDLDGDGVLDIAVGAGGDDDGGEDRGALWVLFLNTDGTVGGEQKVSDTEGGLGRGLDNEDGFGVSGVPLGDLDGDGVGQWAIGAVRDDSAGAVYILSLDDGVTSPCPGDVVPDGVVNSTDLNLLLGAFGDTIDPTCRLDIDNSGLVDSGDLNLLLGAFGQSCAP